MIKKILKKQNGSAIYLAMMILSAALIITLGASGLIISGQKSSTAQFFSTRAYFAAEAGVERALFELRKQGATSCGNGQYFDYTQNPAGCAGSAPLTPFFQESRQSYYTIFFDDITYGIFKSIGDFSDTKRSVEVRYLK